MVVDVVEGVASGKVVVVGAVVVEVVVDVGVDGTVPSTDAPRSDRSSTEQPTRAMAIPTMNNAARDLKI
ncbi:MAG: hypothetical protein RI637_12095 [Acidimicrobiia bacterium]|nr:hypothetical protein [Acidimicrobiia bacterium]